MSIFLSATDRVRIALPDDPENAIYIRPKMNMGQKNHVQGASLSLGEGGKVALDVAAGNNALMDVNFVAWEGPKFTLESGKLAPCTPTYFRQLDPNDPLVELALKEINERNKEAKSPDPKEPAMNISTTDGGSSSETPASTEAA